MSSSPPQKMERLERMRQARGVDYFPSWGRSPIEHWAPTLPVDHLRRELGLARAMGFDHIRVWLSAGGWLQHGDRYVSSVELLLDAAHAHGLGVVAQLFDSCGCEADVPELAEQRIEQIAEHAADDPRLQFIRDWQSPEGRDILDGPAIVPVSWRGDPMVTVWEGWVPSPGYRLLGEEHWPTWDRYVRAVTTQIHNHPALWLLELMNEPFLTQHGQDVDREPIVAFYRHVHEVTRDACPSVPLAMGAQEPEDVAVHERDIGAQLDVVGFHTYTGDDELEAKIAVARETAGDRPVYLSEWGWFPGGDDAAQLAGFEHRVPMLLAQPIAWAVAHLIAGYGPFGLSALLYPSGIMRPAARYLRDALRA